MITPERMMELKKQRPFRPFRVIMKNGETFTVLKRLEFLPIRPLVHLPARRRAGGEPTHIANRNYEDIERIEMLDESGERSERGVA